MFRLPANFVFPFAQGRSFWKLKGFWDRMAFRCSRFFFYRRETLRTKGEEFRIFFSIFRSVSSYTLVIVLLLTSLELAERFIVSHGWDLKLFPPPTDKSYSSMDYALQALTGIQGVFLAVYLGALSVAASAIYADVPHEVRVLLSRDRLGSFFLQFIAACTAVALILLGFRGLGGTIGRGVFLLSIFLGCYSIFAILVVLKKSITLFDPARVGKIIFRDLNQAIRSASIRGFAWKDRSFQGVYSNQAASSLKSLAMVVDICSKKPGMGNQPLSNLMGDTLNSWAVYAYFRGQIPFESDWYRSVYRHKKWLLATELEINLALNTQTTLQPETRKDRNWLEADLLPIVGRGLTSLLERGDVQAAHEGLIGISNLVRSLAAQLDTTNLAAFQAIAKQMTDRWSQLATKKGSSERVRDDREEIGLADSLGMIPISAALGLADWASTFDFVWFEKQVKDTDWSNKKAVYLCGFPYGILGDLEQLQDKLSFEIHAEGKRISPDWYVGEIILLGLLRALKPCVESIQTAIDVTLIKDSNQLFDSKRHRSSCALVLRGLEFIDKFSLALSHVKRVVDGVEARSKISDLPWPKFEFEGLYDKLKESRKDHLRLLGRLVPILSALPDDETLEDYFGASYIHVLEASYLALIHDDEKSFLEFFPAAFQGALSAFDNLKSYVEGWYWETALAVRADVLIDILEIGSYAKFISAYRGKSQAWDVCVKTWDEFLSKHGNPEAVVELVVKMLNFKSRHFGLTPRSVCRVHWQQVLTSYLNYEGSLIERYYVPGRGMPAAHPHPSRLVRKVCTNWGMGIDWPGPDLFAIAYFEIHREAKEPLDISDNHGVRKVLLETVESVEMPGDDSEE